MDKKYWKDEFSNDGEKKRNLNVTVNMSDLDESLNPIEKKEARPSE
jgi:hypothetical protein